MNIFDTSEPITTDCKGNVLYEGDLVIYAGDFYTVTTNGLVPLDESIDTDVLYWNNIAPHDLFLARKGTGK